ncbi:MULTISPECIES: NAD(P)H-hydrate dehydratase [unclassified Brachybacterium]|uniref:NAD(P)H-hydrate dehydratase n=1 Tax=unclassified Brachybacterium TaxID=2623841 RepID=UPI00361BDDD7
MIRGYTAQEVREAEQPLLSAGQPLMLRAARALADRVRERLEAGADGEPDSPEPHRETPVGPRVLVLAGRGSNGGDGLHAAAMLRRDGIAAEAIATADGVHAEGAAALRDAGGTIHSLAESSADDLRQVIAGAGLVLDAILGIGGRPEIPAALEPLLEAVRAEQVPVIAVDVPSFVDATSGRAAPGALAASETVTFGAVKAGLLLPGAAHLTGTLHPVDLGLGEHLPARPAAERLEDSDLRALWPRPERDATKYSRGVVAVVAGSPRFPGAAVLTCSGAARAGAGMVRCVAPQSVLDLVLQTRPEVVGQPTDTVDLEEIGRTDALVVGSGIGGEDPRARAGLDVLSHDIDHAGEHGKDRDGDGGAGGLERGVIDAGGLAAMTAEHRFGSDVVLTPHRGEAERLADRLGIGTDLPGPELAAALAGATGATVLLKGAVTLVAPGDGGPLRAQDDATSQLATAGTGDVLAGVIGTLLAAGLPGPDAAALGAMLHGRAGRLASRDGLRPLVALDVADHLPAALGAILAGALP